MSAFHTTSCCFWFAYLMPIAMHCFVHGFLNHPLACFMKHISVFWYLKFLCLKYLFLNNQRRLLKFYIVIFRLCSSALYSTWYSRGLTTVLQLEKSAEMAMGMNTFQKLWVANRLITSVSVWSCTLQTAPADAVCESGSEYQTSVWQWRHS